MSEIKNSTTDIDNNVQEEAPSTPTPKKRLSRAEKARLESEELLKSLGVTIESGRQTRSSRRGTAPVESPKPEPPKRKQPSTPRASKKAKVVDADQTDGSNHVEESKKNETQIVEASTTNSLEPEKVVEEATPAESEAVSLNAESEQQMEVDTPTESTQPEVKESVPQPESAPQPETIEDSPIEESPIDEPPIEEDSLPIVDEVESAPSLAVVEEPIVLESEGVSAAADTTTIVINDNEPVATSLGSNTDKDDPIELQSSPSDIDQQEDTVTNSQAIIAEPDAIVDLESSSNEGDTKADGVNNSQALSSLDLEVINSDSSLGVSEIQDEIPLSGTVAAAQEQSLPTSTADDVTIIDVAPAAKTNDNNSVHSSERPTNPVESTNNQKPIEIPDKFRTTITVENPIEETITTTSETLLEPSATTA